MTVGMVVGFILMPIVWLMMAGANKQHIKEHGVPMPSRKAMARIRRNARQKGISQGAAYDQWIVNKRRRLPKTSLPRSKDNLVYNVSEAPKPRNWAEAFPKHEGGPVPAASGQAPRPSTEGGSPIVLGIVVAIAVGILGILAFSSTWQSEQRPEPIATPATQKAVVERSVAASAPAATSASPVQGRPVTYGRTADPEPRVSVAALPSSPVTPPPSRNVPSTPSPPAAKAPVQEEARQLVGERWQIAGQKVPLRSEPIVGSLLIDRLNSREAVSVLEQRDTWARVRVERTRKEGWIPAKRIGAKARAREVQEPAAKIVPTLATASIAKLLIAASISNYSGSCACPYQTDRGGRSCGRRSAYSRPGGFSPLCFAKDITPEMVAEYRRTH